MNKRIILSDVWLKASILGANWAASEIILGSFLHNLNIPFKGNILTAIGLILMISVAYKWRDKGLFWRSGLICAFMKTMSPSAIIFGPMMAIFMEALLLEFSVRLLGRNLAGFFLGSALAMSWILAQKIFNYIVYYGFNIVDIYANLLKYAEEQLNIQFDTFWLPILILLGIYILFGLIAALAGVKIARGITGNLEIERQGITPHTIEMQNNRDVNFPYSLSWLVLSFAALVFNFILINKSPVYVWMPASVILVMVWVLRYKRAMRQLLRPRFWIFFIVITLLSAMLISSLNGSQNGWFDGLMVGLQMNFRAAAVVAGFSVLGTELYNPKIRNYLAKSAFKQLPAALELAFESLPFVVANLPDARTFIKKPAGVIKLLIRHADDRFSALKDQQRASVILVTGDVSEGKTTFVAELSRMLLDKGISVGGFYAPRIMHNNQTRGYDLVSIETGEKFSFLGLKRNVSAGDIGKYEINVETLKQGKRILSPENIQGKDVIVVDEIGRLELNGLGWKSSLEKLLSAPNLCLVLTVREDIVNGVVEKFDIRNALIFPVSANLIDNAETAILNKIRNPSAKRSF
jgi:nucleoside-triphosphatase THEP1